MKQLLLIEDDKFITDATVDTLEAEGYKLISANNGHTGIQLAIERHPDLIICDIMMPGLDGYGVLSLLQQNSDTSTIPFIFLTAKADKKDVRFGMDSGADDYLVKPFTREELLGAVKARLHHRGALDDHYKDQHGAGETIPITLLVSAPERTLTEILHEAAQMVKLEDGIQASGFYHQALKLDSTNETALIWLTFHAADPYDTVALLEKLVEKYPERMQFQELLTTGRRRCKELDQLISSSDVLGYWTMAEHIQQERIQNGSDTRSASVTPIGQLMLKQGVITVEQLDTAVVIQSMLARLGEAKKLGEVLLEYGYVTQKQLKTVLNDQLNDFNSQFY